MTKTEAANILATEVRVFARKSDATIDKDLVEARVSEHMGAMAHEPRYGTLLHQAALVQPSWRTILRVAKAGA